MSIRFESTLTLYGVVGDDFNAKDVRDALNDIGNGPIDVHVNSGGGFANEGLAIYNTLIAYTGQVTLYVDGMAASAASLIAMAGNTIVMCEGAMMMIHDPSTIAGGTSRDLRKSATDLDQLGTQYSNIYAKRSGLKPDAIAEMMAAETWMDADHAIKLGFATRKSSDTAMAAAKFDYRIYRNSPTMLTQKGHPSTMTTESENNVQDKAWAGKFMRSAETSGIALAQLNAIVDASASIDVARDALIDAMAKRTNANHPRPGGNDMGTGDQSFSNPTFLGNAISEAIYCRMSGKAPGPKSPAREWMGRTVLDMGVAVALAHGRRISWDGGRYAVAGAVMAGGQHTTSDFPNLLGATGNRILLDGYQASQSPLKLLARKRVANDFRPLSSLRLGESPALLPVKEGAEITYGTRSENAEKNQLQTFARLFSLSRQALVNDDLVAFGDSARTWGMAAALCEADFLATIFLANSEAGVNMSDGNPIYTTGRANKLSGGGSAMSTTSLGNAQAALRNMKGLDGKTFLNLVPKYLVTGAILESAAQAQCALITPTRTADVNPFGGNLTNLVEPRFTSATSWRLFTDPQQLPALEIAYLNGVEGPVVEQRDGWDVDGIDFKCRFDFGAAPIEWRATVYSAGA